jgi:hypothetical protein
MAEYPTAIQTQNALRAVLNIYFPGDTDDSKGGSGYHQFMFPLLLPELGGLWAPIFCEVGPDSVGLQNQQPSTAFSSSHKQKKNQQNPQQQRRHVDMILAVGMQTGVKRDFFLGIVGQLEKLGTKPSGDTRSGRLDFR